MASLLLNTRTEMEFIKHINGDKGDVCSKEYGSQLAFHLPLLVHSCSFLILFSYCCNIIITISDGDVHNKK